ncbi:hypothetical protein FDK38_003182 [Candidozyma auris]|nr:hypothetical protein FDK38_003182 [[Candida] auris]
MSESLAAGTASTPVRTLSKSSNRSALSSPENSAPGSPNRPGLSSSPDPHGPLPISDNSRNASSASPPPIPNDTSDDTTRNGSRPQSSSPNVSSASPSSILGSSAERVGDRPTTTPANTAFSSGSSNNTTNNSNITTSNTINSTSNNDATYVTTPVAQSAPSAPSSRPQQSGMVRRPSFGLGFLSSLSNSIRGSHAPQGGSSQQNSSETTFSSSNSGTSHHHTSPESHPHSHLHTHSSHAAPQSTHQFMSNSPTIANLNGVVDAPAEMSSSLNDAQGSSHQTLLARQDTMVRPPPVIAEEVAESQSEAMEAEDPSGKDKDGFFSVRLTPIIDHSTSNTGLYFSPMIRRIKPKESISIGRYTEKNKSAAHAPQGSSAPIVFKSKVVSRTHAMFQVNEDGSWFIKDCKSSSGTFLNNQRLSPASQESTLCPLADGDMVQLGLDYRGGTEEVYRCVKMRCEFNRSWQRKVNQFNLDIHKNLKKLRLDNKTEDDSELSECAICLLKLEPCQALFISPCSHSWHYKCIRPIIIKSYPHFYCPNCRSMCDLETDIEDD